MSITAASGSGEAALLGIALSCTIGPIVGGVVGGISGAEYVLKKDKHTLAHKVLGIEKKDQHPKLKVNQKLNINKINATEAQIQPSTNKIQASAPQI